MLTTVIHLRQATPGAAWVYIGRPGHGYPAAAAIWGNPFQIGRDGSRAEVIEKHRQWLARQPHLLARIHELRGKQLACFCCPAACHGETLARIANALQEAPCPTCGTLTVMRKPDQAICIICRRIF